MKCLLNALIRTLGMVKLRIKLVWLSTDYLWDSGPGEDLTHEMNAKSWPWLDLDLRSHDKSSQYSGFEKGLDKSSFMRFISMEKFWQSPEASSGISLILSAFSLVIRLKGLSFSGMLHQKIFCRSAWWNIRKKRQKTTTVSINRFWHFWWTI